jgi:hypothetical protein
MALTATKGKRTPHTVHPLAAPITTAAPLPDAEKIVAECDLCETQERFHELKKIIADNWKRWPKADAAKITAAVNAMKAKLETQQPTGELFPGTTNPMAD